MKTFLFAGYCTVLFLIGSPFLSTGQDCTKGIPDESFQRGLGRIAAQPDNQGKLDRALDMIKWGCLTSAQVRSVANVFTDDFFRYQFARTAFSSTTDKENFFDVYDAFRSFSYALRLYESTHTSDQEVRMGRMEDHRKYESPRRDPQPAPDPMPVFANLPYPSSFNYTGNKGCAGPIADDASFRALAIMVSQQPSDESKYVAILTRVQEGCFSMEQIMKVSTLIAGEKIRLKTLMDSFTKTYDQDHYPAARSLFTAADIQNQWMSAAQVALTPPPPACVVEQGDLNAIIISIHNKNFPTEKLGVVDQVKGDRCFNTGQIAAITKEFPFDKDRLEVLKRLYDKCTDQNNYYRLSDVLTFGFVKDDFNSFLTSKRH